MAEPLFSIPPLKRSRISKFNDKTCIFCSGKFTTRKPAKFLNLANVKLFFEACAERNDEIGREIICYEDEIKNGDVTVNFHSTCKATYISKQNIKHCKQSIHGSKRSDCNLELGGELTEGAGEGGGGSYTRAKSKDIGFDWKRKCFICSKDCQPNDRYSERKSWSMVTTLANSPADVDIYEKTLSAALQREDLEMITRLHGVPNKDLVATDARYHQKKNCLARYINQDDINRANQEAKEESNVNMLLQLLIDELNTPVVIEKKVFLLSALRKRIFELAIENNICLDSYRSHLLKAQLSQMWPDLVFYEQRGKSYLVCHKDITATHIMSKMGEIAELVQKSSNDDSECEYAEAEGDEVLSEEAIVHRAVGILRKRTKGCVKKLDGEYISAAELTPEKGLPFIDPLLYKMVCWMADDNLYKAASIPESIDSKAYSIACDMSTLCSLISSPKHLGLSLHLHHSYSRRDLIEDIYSLGYGVSYTEVRHFLTSAAVHVTSSAESLPSGALLPHKLKIKENGRSLIVGAADNWDHNEHTIDGKRATHAMTSVLVTIEDEAEANAGHDTRIKRSPSRVFNLQNLPGGNLSNVIEYKKPTKRPEPVILPPPTSDELKPDLTEPVVQTAQQTELAYQICRYIGGSATSFPPWGPFHVSISNKNIPTSKVVYNPILMAPPTDYSTIYTTLLRNRDIAQAVGQKYLPMTFDMGLLPKALEITWARPDELSGVIPMEGGMHLLFALVAGIGSIYGTAGLSALLCNSGVYAAGTVQNIFRGKDFDRGLHALKLIHEVLFSEYLKSFKQWCEMSDITSPDFDAISSKGTAIHDRYKGTNAKEDTELPDHIQALCSAVEDISGKLEVFAEECKQVSATFQFWSEYLEKVSLPLMMHISSTRNGNWQLHQTTKEQLLPLLFASGRNTYAKYMTIQLLLLKRLPLEVQESFLTKSQFVAKLSDGHFNATAIDYVLESTENKELKGTYSVLPGAVESDDD